MGRGLPLRLPLGGDSIRAAARRGSWCCSGDAVALLCSHPGPLPAEVEVQAATGAAGDSDGDGDGDRGLCTAAYI